MHLNSKLLFETYALDYFKDHMKVLEIGPSGYPSQYCKSVGNSTIDWHTLDIGETYLEDGETNPSHIFSKSEYHYPIEDNQYDLIVSGQVMEHVRNIWLWMEELKRITKKGGYIIIISPISWEYHEAPTDCWRIYPDGIRALIEDKGLSIDLCKFESLELGYFSVRALTIPGNSVISLEGKKFMLYKILEVIHKIPLIRNLARRISVSYDNICIAHK